MAKIHLCPATWGAPRLCPLFTALITLYRLGNSKTDKGRLRVHTQLNFPVTISSENACKREGGGKKSIKAKEPASDRDHLSHLPAFQHESSAVHCLHRRQIISISSPPAPPNLPHSRQTGLDIIFDDMWVQPAQSDMPQLPSAAVLGAEVRDKVSFSPLLPMRELPT